MREDAYARWPREGLFYLVISYLLTRDGWSGVLHKRAGRAVYLLSCRKPTIPVCDSRMLSKQSKKLFTPGSDVRYLCS